MNAAPDIASKLIAHREMFLTFVRSRVGDPQLAEDIVQESFLKALKGARGIRDNESVVAWFYRILRRTVIDTYRRRAARTRALNAYEAEARKEMNAEEERALCGCLRLLTPTLKPEYGKVIERVDLKGESMERVAADLGISPANVRVRLHRGRKQLLERVRETCRVCAQHHCLDCECEHG